MPYATFVNVLTVVIGSLLGLFLEQRLTPELKEIVFQAIGLSSLALGMKMAFQSRNFLVVVFSLVLGGLLGTAFGVGAGVEGMAEDVKRALGSDNSRFVEGLTTAFILFCIGSVTIVGAIEEGTQGKRDLLLVKSVLDGFSSIALSATFGYEGVMSVAVPMLIFQGGVTLAAAKAERFFTPSLIDELSAVGGALVVGIGIDLLEIKEVRLKDLLPALPVAVALTLVAERLGPLFPKKD